MDLTLQMPLINKFFYCSVAFSTAINLRKRNCPFISEMLVVGGGYGSFHLLAPLITASVLPLFTVKRAPHDKKMYCFFFLFVPLYPLQASRRK